MLKGLRPVRPEWCLILERCADDADSLHVLADRAGGDCGSVYCTETSKSPNRPRQPILCARFGLARLRLQELGQRGGWIARDDKWAFLRAAFLALWLNFWSFRHIGLHCLSQSLGTERCPRRESHPEGRVSGHTIANRACLLVSPRGLDAPPRAVLPLAGQLEHRGIRPFAFLLRHPVG